MLSLAVIQPAHLWEKERKQSLKISEAVSKYAATMTQLGQDFNPSEELQDLCEEFNCSLYGKPGKSVKEVRYSIFCSRSSQCYQLPPTKDALRKHIKKPIKLRYGDECKNVALSFQVSTCMAGC